MQEDEPVPSERLKKLLPPAPAADETGTPPATAPKVEEKGADQTAAKPDGKPPPAPAPSKIRRSCPPPIPPLRIPHPRLVLLACLLLALLQVLWSGYELGAGNQSIQIPFLERIHDPSAFKRDAMVNTTIDQYPSHFYRFLAKALRVVPLAPLYLTLHLLTAFSMLVILARMCRASFASHWAGLVAILFVLAGHHRALAEETLYSTGFTHTWAVFPLMIAALALLYRGRHLAAFALTGILFNFHALEAAYVGTAMAFWAICSYRELGLPKIIGLLLVSVALASPTLLPMAGARQHFDADWLQFTRIRSSQHSFPFSWWQSGHTDIPRFLMILALAGASLSLHVSPSHVRKTLLIVAGVGILFAIGTVFTEVRPVPVVIRAQLLRSSKFLVILAFIFIALGCVRAWSLPFEKNATVARWQAWLEALSAAFTVFCLAVPSVLVLLPLALLMAILVALINRRLFWQQAVAAGIALLVTLAAWRTISFALPGISAGFSLKSLVHWQHPDLVGWAILAAAVALWWIAQKDIRRPAAWAIGIAGMIAAAAVTAWAYASLLTQPGSDAAWVDVQRWAREHTPPNTLFLAGMQPGGFRIQSKRAVVAEWRDGTQLYFSASYGRLWWKHMNTLQPGMRISPDGKRLLVQGRSLSQMDDQQVIAMAKRFRAQYVVLAADPPRRLWRQHGNSKWVIYRPEYTPAAFLESGAAAEQKRFMDEVVLPNIEKNRKGSARVQVIDSSGRPLYDAKYRIVQTRNGFKFGVSLPCFVAPPDTDVNPLDFRPPTVTPPQLARFLETFNFSVISRSAWWASIEPREGQPRRYDDLDRYLAWCKEQRVTTEFSFLGGFAPAWLKLKPEPEQAQRLLQHAQDLVGRYADRVDYWQAFDQGLFMNQATNLVSALRAKNPQVKLGISDSARFYSPVESPHREVDLMRGLDDLRRLKGQGARMDFVSLHGYQPWGVWADPRIIYEVLDAYHKEGVRIHITEFEAPSEGWIEGKVRTGQWNPLLQAEYTRLFYTVCFSHPAVDAINQAELGPLTRLPGGGLLAADDQPKPAFDAIKELVTQRWRTRTNGVVPLDGTIKFHGFHGEYDLEVTTTSGKIARTTFNVATEGENRYRFQLNANADAFTRLK
jgi:hypothetical protein